VTDLDGVMLFRQAVHDPQRFSHLDLRCRTKPYMRMRKSRAQLVLDRADTQVG
jgi:tRNA-dihydrouridine synthase